MLSLRNNLSASVAQATNLQAATHIPSAVLAHTTIARSALVATVEYVGGIATSSSVQLKGMVEQTLVAMGSQVVAIGAIRFQEAMAASQLAPMKLLPCSLCPP